MPTKEVTFSIQGRISLSFSPTLNSMSGKPMEGVDSGGDEQVDPRGRWRRAAGEGEEKQRPSGEEEADTLHLLQASKAISIASSFSSWPIMEKLPAARKLQAYDAVFSRSTRTSVCLVVPSKLAKHAVSEAPRPSPSSPSLRLPPPALWHLLCGSVLLGGCGASFYLSVRSRQQQEKVEL